MKPTFSTIIPTYNSSSMLPRAIDSVLNQSYLATEILVIDDGSDDSTREVAQTYGNKIRYVVLAHTGCPGAVRNHGIAESRGDYVAFLDADDVWYPNKLETIAQLTAKYPETGLFYSDFNFVDEQLHFLRRARCKDISGHAYKRLLRDTPIATSTVVVR